jgi:hypothetical protein
LAKTALEIDAKAERLRIAARSTDAILEAALLAAGFNVIRVDNGRLCVETDRGLEPYSELSHGERWTIAFDLAATGLKPGAVLALCQEAYESLDPLNKELLNRLALERQIVVITAQATDGILRAELIQ